MQKKVLDDNFSNGIVNLAVDDIPKHKPLETLVDLLEPNQKSDFMDGDFRESKVVVSQGCACPQTANRCMGDSMCGEPKPFTISCLFCSGWPERELVEQIHNAPQAHRKGPPNQRIFATQGTHASAAPLEPDESGEQEEEEEEMELRTCPADPCMWLVDNTMPMSKSGVGL